jgi:hypothetical protein
MLFTQEPTFYYHNNKITNNEMNVVYTRTNMLGLRNVVQIFIHLSLHHSSHFIAPLTFHDTVGHYNCLIDLNNQVIHKLSTQGSLLFQR